MPVTAELRGGARGVRAGARATRDFHAWVGTENYEMRVAPDLAWIDQRILDIVRGAEEPTA